MLDQVGPQRLFKQLRDEFPRYAKLLPELPRLLAGYLEQGPAGHKKELALLLAEQRRTNRLLQSIVYGGMGFVLGLLVLQLVIRIRLF